MALDDVVIIDESSGHPVSGGRAITFGEVLAMPVEKFFAGKFYNPAVGRHLSYWHYVNRLPTYIAGFQFGWWTTGNQYR